MAVPDTKCGFAAVHQGDEVDMLKGTGTARDERDRNNEKRASESAEREGDGLCTRLI